MNWRFTRACTAMCFVFVTMMACTSTDSRYDRIEKRLTAMDSVLGQIQDRTNLNTVSGPIVYVISDVKRNSKDVGTIMTRAAIRPGDRIFLGDEMWDVVYAKVFGKKLSDLATDSTYSVGSIQLLVRYGGKAEQPPSPQ